MSAQIGDRHPVDIADARPTRKAEGLVQCTDFDSISRNEPCRNRLPKVAKIGFGWGPKPQTGANLRQKVLTTFRQSPSQVIHAWSWNSVDSRRLGFAHEPLDQI